MIADKFIELLTRSFNELKPTEQALFLSKIKPKPGVGNALADMDNSISDKDFWEWQIAVQTEYESNFVGLEVDSPDEDYEDSVGYNGGRSL